MSHTAENRAIVPASMEAEHREYRFSPGYRRDGWLFVSGQLGLRSDGTAPADPAEQARLAFAGLKQVLDEAGSSVSDIAVLNSYHVGDVADSYTWFRPVKDAFFTEPYPAWTAIQVAGLAAPGAVVEINAIVRESN